MLLVYNFIASQKSLIVFIVALDLLRMALMDHCDLVVEALVDLGVGNLGLGDLVVEALGILVVANLVVEVAAKVFVEEQQGHLFVILLLNEDENIKENMLQYNDEDMIVMIFIENLVKDRRSTPFLNL